MFSFSILITAAVIRTAAELARATDRYEPSNRPFDITASITCPPCRENHRFYAMDETGAVELNTFPGDWGKIRSGDVFHLKGFTRRHANRIGIVHADCNSAEFISHGKAIPPVDIDVHNFLTGRHLFKFVRMQGTICNIFRDEIDANYIYFIIENGDERVFAVLWSDNVRALPPNCTTRWPRTFPACRCRSTPPRGSWTATGIALPSGWNLHPSR